MRGRTCKPEFREGAVRLVLEQGLTVERAAKDLGMPSHTLYARVAHARKGNGVFLPKADRDLQARVRELEAETRRLRAERDILRKATAFFAREPS
ncbi:MAG: transposase [Phycisphaeraceae bacterium]|nr:transposase [Phycisphaeraceae bacterium]